MKSVYVLSILILGHSLVSSLNYISTVYKENVAVKIVSLQNPKTEKNGSPSYCANICTQDSNCLAYDIDTTLTCNFYPNFTGFAYDNSVTTYLNSVYNFQLLPGLSATYNHSDGLLYIFGAPGVYTWQQAYDFCRNIQGFSLILAKKICQFKMLLALQSTTLLTYAIGLRRNATTIYWDDGTVYSASEVHLIETPLLDGTLDPTFSPTNVFLLFWGHYNDEVSTFSIFFKVYPVCTANPFNQSMH